jgi:hypothetical protein
MSDFFRNFEEDFDGTFEACSVFDVVFPVNTATPKGGRPVTEKVNSYLAFPRFPRTNFVAFVTDLIAIGTGFPSGPKILTASLDTGIRIFVSTVRAIGLYTVIVNGFEVSVAGQTLILR